MDSSSVSSSFHPKPPADTETKVAAEEKPTETRKHYSAFFRFGVKQKGELIDRIQELAIKKGFSKEERTWLESALFKVSSMKASNPEQFIAKARSAFATILKDHEKEYQEGQIKERLATFDKIVKDVEAYKVTFSTPSSVVLSTDELAIKTRYEKGESIPEYIKHFDVNAKHTMNPDKYLDVRLSRKVVQSMTFVNQYGNKKNIELFIGPADDMRKFYHLLGYKEVGLLGMKSSNRFYYFENPQKLEDAKVVITGFLNSSRLNNMLLMLKFAGVSMNNVIIRGTFADALSPALTELDHELGSFPVPVEVAFIGNRTQILIQLAERLYPTEMESVKEPNAKEKMAESLLADHDLKTVSIGESFKFSYVTSRDASGKNKKGILAFRMPNGSLSYEAVRLVIQHGAKNIVMIGAGGSMDSQAGVGSYQVVTASTYGDKTIYIPQENLMALEIPNLVVKENRINKTVDTPLVENDEWMRKVSENDVTSVDVETYHIFRAITEQISNGFSVAVFPGLFTSDVLGEHPLEQKISPDDAWKKLPELLHSSFDVVGFPDDRPKATSSTISTTSPPKKDEFI